MPDELQLNLGVLRSAMQLTLHTRDASRVWHGRPRKDGRPGIVGFAVFASIMAAMQRGAEQDDPYSDWWMLRIEEKLAETKKHLQVLRDQVNQILADIPPALTLGDNLNVQPVKLPLFVNSRLGFVALYLLADYDELARRLMLAHHTALIDWATRDQWLQEGAHLLRSAFTLALQYRFSGARRDDFAANNAVARTAREKYGELPRDVLEGTRRSRYAPRIKNRSPLSTGDPVPLSEAGQTEVETGEFITDSSLDDLDRDEPA